MDTEETRLAIEPVAWVNRESHRQELRENRTEDSWKLFEVSISSQNGERFPPAVTVVKLSPNSVVCLFSFVRCANRRMCN
uniref:Uncharacterized protein n=1 Tax=Glossina palpalis gambiensis TaxID=67801 RepID=A0A1B0AYV6_9MUSC